jgi:phosphoglycerol transferase MdoB-like AlkP superfamily enzyme
MIRLKLLSMRLGLLLLLYSGLRALFLVFNLQAFDRAPVKEIVDAFLVGLRFDIAAILVINGALIFFSLLPGPLWERRWYQRSLKILFFVSNIPFLIINVADVEYFKFIGQRSTFSLFDMRADIGAQLGQLIFHYWYLVAAGLLLIFLFYYFFPERQPTPAGERQSAAKWARDFAIMIAVVPAIVLGVRGGLQRKVISTVQADVFDGMNLSHLALNSSFTLIHSQPGCDSRALPKFHFFATNEELKKEFPSQVLSSLPKSERPDNVVIIIVESLSAQYTGMGDPRRGFTPFLDELGQKRGILFKNHFADARRSIDALPSILAGLPHLVDETFYCAQQKHLTGIGSLLKERGYTTSFFHGGKNGTMYFDVFSKRMGFDRYYGLNEYPKPADSDGIWGIYDEPFLQFMAQELTRYKEPFASVAFTLSSHNPYKIPPQYEGRFAKGDLPILESVGYMDYSLKKFFETAEKMPWYKNTLFVITGDHTASPRTTYSRLIDAYRVPLILFHPGVELPKVNPDRIVQHIDIGPSILDFLGVAADKMAPFGHSIFDPAFDGLAFSQLNGNYWIADKKYYLEYRLHGPSKMFDMAHLESPVTDKPEVKARLEKKLEAYLQRFNNGLAEDKLYN